MEGGKREKGGEGKESKRRDGEREERVGVGGSGTGSRREGGGPRTEKSERLQGTGHEKGS